MQKLQERASNVSPLCIGLDTDVSYLPQSVLEQFPTQSEAVFAYNKAIIQRTYNSVACYKVQIAYYEKMGMSGLGVYKDTLQEIRQNAQGALAISDIKRGDIAATAKAYAAAHFEGDFATDIVTLNQYMGFDTLEPWLSYCTKTGGGKAAFLLLCTSNKGMADIEKQVLADGTLVLDISKSYLNAQAKLLCNSWDNATCSPLGAVVGCTHKDDAVKLRAECKDVFFLIPGFGAQGGDACIVAALLTGAGGVVNSSRGILCAWKNDANLTEKAHSGKLTLDDIADSAARQALLTIKEIVACKKDAGL